MIKEFRQLFRGLERAHGLYTITGTKKEKVAGKARTVIEPVTDELWEKHLAGVQGLGIVPINDKGECYFGALDIDVYPLDLEALSVRIAAMGLPLVVCRTKSGGAHLYCFGKEPLPASLLRERLQLWATSLGFTGCEIFPKQVNLASEEDVGNWINMPYFEAERTMRYAIRNEVSMTPKQFITYANSIAMTVDDLEGAVPEMDKRLEGAPPCLVHLSMNGVPEGGRNTALFNYGVFCRLSAGDDWEEKLSYCNKNFMSPPLADKEFQVIKKSLEKKSYYYSCKQQPLVDICNKPVCKTCEFGVGGDAEVNVDIGKLTKIMTVPPTWVITIGDTRMELTTDDLIMQQRFRKMCVDRLNVLPQLVKGPKWDEFVRDALANCEVVEAPEDSGPAGLFKHHLRMFCTGPLRTDEKENLLVGRVWSNKNKVYFQAAALMMYLDQQRFRLFDMRKAWNWIEENNGGHSTFTLKGLPTRVWWIEDFKLIDGELKLPKLEEEM